MKLSILAGATSQSVNVFIQDSSKTNGAGLTGLVFNSSGLIAYYTFAGANAGSAAITLATLAAVNSAYSSGGFKEIDATNMPGVYRLDLPNAALAASKGRSVLVMLSGATNMAPVVLEVELTGWDNQDAVHAGLSALPNAAAGASGGLWLMTSVVEGTKTVQQYLQWMAAALFGKLSGVSTNTPTFLSPSDGTTTRIAATVTSDGRNSVTLS